MYSLPRKRTIAVTLKKLLNIPNLSIINELRKWASIDRLSQFMLCEYHARGQAPSEGETLLELAGADTRYGSKGGQTAVM